MKGAEPFELSAPGDTAVMLIHGFTSSAYSMRELGEKLQAADFNVKGILLPGHGTTPEDLEKTPWEEWYCAVESVYLNLTKNFKKIIVCGQSMGGCLAMYLASFYPVNGVIAIASGLKLSDKKLWMLPLVKYFIRFIPKLNGPDVKNPEAKLREVHYPVMPVRSVMQLQKFLIHLKSRMSAITAPAMFIHALDDHTFGYQNMEVLYNSVSSSVKKKITLYNSYHIATLDYDKAIVQNETIAFIRSL